MAVANSNAGAKPKISWLSFSLRTLFLLTILTGVFLGWLGKILIHVRHQHNIVAQLPPGAVAYFDYQAESRAPAGPKWIRFLFGDSAFANVQEVHLDPYQPSKDTDLVLLLKLPKLKRVSVAGPDITDRGMQHLAQLPLLQELKLRESSVTADGLAEFHTAYELERLTLEGRSVNDDTLQHLGKLPRLRFLCLQDTQVTSAGLGHLIDMEHLCELEFAGDNKSIDDDGMRHLAGIHNLKRLDVSNTSITDAGLEHLARLHNLEALETRNAPITDAGLQHLAGLRKLRNLRLNGTKVEDLGHLQKLMNLHSLDLSESSVSDAGLEQLETMQSLDWLFLAGTVVSEDAVLRLAQRKKLRWLCLDANFDKTRFARIKQLMPDCNVELDSVYGFNSW